MLKLQNTDGRLVVGTMDTPKALLGDLERGCRVVGLLLGKVSFIDLIEEVLLQVGPSRLMLSSWTTGLADTEHMGVLIRQGLIENITLCIDRSFATRHDRYARALVSVYGKEALRVTRTHAKFACIANDEGWRIVLRGSMNLNRNKRLEQFDLDDDESIYELYRSVVMEITSVMDPGIYKSTSEVDAEVARLLHDNPYRPGGEETSESEDDDDLMAMMRRAL